MSLNVTAFTDTTAGDEYRAIILQLGTATADLTRWQAIKAAWTLVKAAVKI